MQSTNVPAELKDLRKRFGRSLKECGDALGLSIEGYRMKELGDSPITGQQLATLADFYGMPLRAAFPSYEPTEPERALARHLDPAA